LLIQHSGISQITAALRSASGSVLLISVVFYWAGQVLSAAKWRILLRTQGAYISLLECCRLYFIGMFCNLWLPTNIGGDAVRAVLVAPKAGGGAIAVSSIFVERITGFLALLLIGIVALLADLASTRKRSGLESPYRFWCRLSLQRLLLSHSSACRGAWPTYGSRKLRTTSWCGIGRLCTAF
jgi:uncharacterized protein (TIRG00374 family)